MSPQSAAPERAQPRPGPSYKWWLVGMLWLICFFNYADRQAIFSVFKLLEKEFGFNKTELGWIGAAFMWVYAITAPFAGQVGDRLHRKSVILAGLYVWSLVTGFTAACSSGWQFMLVRGAEGLGETFYFPASMSMISDYHTRRTRSRAMGLHQTSVYAGTIGGSAIAGWIGESLGWRAPFLLFGGLGVLLGFLLTAFVREPARNEAERMEAGRADARALRPPGPLHEFLGFMLRTPTLCALMLAFLGANSVAGVFLAWMPTFLNEKFRLSLTVAGVGAVAFLQIASMVGALFGGYLADRLRPRWAGGRVLVQAMAMLLAAPFIFLCGATLDLMTLTVAMTCFGFFKGMYDANIWAAMYDVVPPERRATTLGIGNLLGWLGAGCAAPALGRAVDNGISMSAAISSTAVIYLASASLLLLAGAVLLPRDLRRLGDAPAR
jgi:MFS family permease